MRSLHSIAMVFVFAALSAMPLFAQDALDAETQRPEDAKAQSNEGDLLGSENKARIEAIAENVKQLQSYRETDRQAIHDGALEIQKVSGRVEYIYWVGPLIVTLVTIGLSFGVWKTIRGSVETTLHDSFDKDIGEIKSNAERDLAKLKEGAEKTLQEGLDALERLVSDLARMTRMSEAGRHDDAIEAMEWDGELDTLNRYPTEIRKYVIRSAVLAKYQKNAEELKKTAWTAAHKIYNDDKSEDNLSFLYELAAESYDWEQGLDLLNGYSRKTPIVRSARGFFGYLRILRNNLRYDDTDKANNLYKGRRTRDINHYLGHIENNRGRFEEADRLLSDEIEEILRAGKAHLSAGWRKVAYSFLLNCSEWGQPERGIDVARFSGRNPGDSLLQLGVLRLAYHLDAAGDNNTASELVNAVKKNLPKLDDDVVKLQIQALLKAHDGDIPGAIDLLRKNQKDVEARRIGFLSEERSVYFYRCLIGELLTENENYEDARDVLHNAALDDKVGEAHFRIAVSYAREGRHEECARHVDHAGKIHRRWCHIAKNAELYPEVVAAHASLSRDPCAALPETAWLN